jgi:hypothetical protein
MAVLHAYTITQYRTTAALAGRIDGDDANAAIEAAECLYERADQ